MSELKLTPSQREAILTVDRSLCIRAGAGCGKTGVLAYHYAALLLLKGLQPQEVVAVTFTEKAAGELKTRIQMALQEAERGALPFQDQVSLKSVEIGLLLQEIPQAPISTLHGLAGRIVREASLLTGFDPHFEILDENQAEALKFDAVAAGFGDLLKDSSEDFKLLIRNYGWSSLQNQIQGMLEDWPAWKKLGVNPSPSFSAEEKKLWQALRSVFAGVFARYEFLKQSRQALDFNDLEEEAHLLLSQNHHVVRHYQKLWKAYLIDEFQDTNERQEELVSLLLGMETGSRKPEAGSWKQQESGLQPPVSGFGPNVSRFTLHASRSSDRHLAIVGDEKQSIYSFRGAEPHIFEKFQKKIESNGGLTVSLTQNFRSPSSLIAWVNSLFAPVFPHSPPLQTEKSDPSGPSLEVLAGPPRSEGEGPKMSADERRLLEARHLARRVAQLLAEGVEAQKIFLLFRSMTPVSIYLKAFREFQIPVYVKSSESLLDRQEILDLVHALRAVVEPENPLSWIGLLRSPAVGLSDEQILEHALAHPEDPAWSKLHPLTQALRRKNKTASVYDFLNWFLEKSDLISLYSATKSLSLKAQNILQFLNGAHQWEAHHAGGLKEFLKEIDRLQENRIRMGSLSDQLGLGGAVTLMTIHQAKGLDLPIVILPDLGAATKNDGVSIADQGKGRVGMKILKPSEGLKREFESSETLNEIREEKEKLSKEEEDRIFYVAVTRATDKMILGFLPEDERKMKGASYPSLLSKTLCAHPSVHWIREEESVSLPPPSETSIRKTFFTPLRAKTVTHFAVTQLECFLRSKEEYRERYVYGIPPRDFSKWKPEAGGQKLEDKDKIVPASGLRLPASSLDPLERGNLIHETLCLMSRPGQALTLEEILGGLWARHAHLREDRESFDSLLKILSETVRHPRFRPVLEAEEGYSEIPFILNLPPYEIRGAMDRLIREDGVWKVVDYKTHHLTLPSPSRERGRGEGDLVGKVAQEFEFQIKTYCLAASRMSAKPVTQALVYFVESNLTHPFFFSEDHLKAHERSLIRLMDEINSTSNNGG